MSRKLISFDWAMKKLLRSKANFGILEGFLSELLKRDIKILNLLESESNKENADNKQNRVDIIVKADGQEIILVEVQVDMEYDYFYRMLYGTSKVIAEYLRGGNHYDEIKKVYSINILYFDLGHGDDYIYHGTTTFKGLHKNDELQLNPKQRELYQKESVHQLYPEYYIIKVNNFNDLAKDTLDEWIYFLKNEEIKDGFHAKGLSEAKEILSEIKMSEEEYRAYQRHLDSLLYENSMMHTNFKLGKIEGEKEGLIEGKKEGKKEGKIEVATNMKNKGLASELISEITGLTIAEIEKI